MKRDFVLILIVCWSYGYGQQNLFNIPSGDITPQRKIFFQQQVNAYNFQRYESKSHFVYGLSRNIDIGINFVNLPVFFSKGVRLGRNDHVNSGPLYPALLQTAQAQWPVCKYLKFNVGYLAGINIPRTSSRLKPLYQFYGITKVIFSKSIRFLVGSYYANKFLVGARSNLGILAGYEIIITKKFYLMGDYISGRNASSAAVIGVNYNLSKRVQICSGILIATPSDGVKPGMVFELNILGYDMEH